MERRFGLRALIELLFRFCAEFLFPRYRGCLVVSILLTLQTAFTLPLPLLSARLLDYAVSSRDGANAFYFAGFLALITALQFAVALVGKRAELRVREQVFVDVQSKLIRHIYRLPLSYFDDKQAAYIQSRLAGDVRCLDGFLPHIILPLVLQLVMYPTILALVFVMAPQLGLIALIGTLMFGIVFYLTSRDVHALGKAMQEVTSRAAGVVSDGLAGIRTVRAYCAEESLIHTSNAEFLKIRGMQLKVGFTWATFGTAATAAAELTLVALIAYGAYAIAHDHITVGQLFGVVMFLGILFRPVATLVESHLQVQKAAAAASRIYELLALRTERHEPPSELLAGPPRAAAGIQPIVRFADVDFEYPRGGRVLQRLNLDIYPGECVALVGSSGAGKTTAIGLLLGLYDGYQGAIFLDGLDIRSLPLDRLRKRIGLVDQSSHIFAGTILQNIRLARPDATVQEVEASAKAAFAHDFIVSLPQGYETVVGERGVGLSAGQSQRIAVARVFLKDPEIIVLDEAVSSVDSESENRIQHALSSLVRGRTSIIVAHRLSSLKLATRVLVLDGGRVIEEGNHEELAATSRVYRRLFEEQFAPVLTRATEPIWPLLEARSNRICNTNRRS